MEMLYIMIPAAIFLGIVGLVFFIWSVKSGQFEDVEGPKHRIFFDDDGKGPKSKPAEPVERSRP